MAAVKIARPVFRLLYNQADITSDLTAFQTEVTYTGDLDGDEADNIELGLEDTDGRWRSGWYPRKGDTLTLAMGYEGEPLVPCGDFEIDEINLQGPPSAVRIRALSAGVTRDLRTHKAHAYEETTLAGVVRTVAARHGLTVVGEVEAVPIRRATQLHEHDLKFLQRLAREYGYAFNVRGQQLIFHRLDTLRAGAAVAVLRPQDVGNYNLRDKIKGTPRHGRVQYHDPKAKRTMAFGLDSSGSVVPEVSADTLALNSRAESTAQARAKSRAALNRANDDATTGTLTMWGRPELVAGVNVELEDFGMLSGRWQVKRHRHHIDRSGGYVTELETRRVEVNGASIPAGRGKGKTGLKAATMENGRVVLK